MANGLLRRIRPLILRVEERVGRGAIPADGMSVPAFVEAFAQDVSPEDVLPVLTRLHRRKAVWLRRHRGAVVIYREKPENVPVPMAIGDGLIDRFCGAVAPLVLSLVHSLVESRVGDPEGSHVEDVAAGRVVDVCHRYVAKGADLVDMRAAMWALFPERAMVAVSWHEPRLQREAEETRIEFVQHRQRSPKGAPASERIVALIGRAGVRGMTENDLCRSMRSGRNEIASELARLEGDRRVMQLPAVRTRGRPSVRWGLVAV